MTTPDVPPVHLTAEEREALGERVCWNCRDRDVWSAVERIVAAHTAAAVAEAVARIAGEVLSGQTVGWIEQDGKTAWISAAAVRDALDRALLPTDTEEEK